MQLLVHEGKTEPHLEMNPANLGPLQKSGRHKRKMTL